VKRNATHKLLSEDEKNALKRESEKTTDARQRTEQVRSGVFG
jgi:hypothetical protein